MKSNVVDAMAKLTNENLIFRFWRILSTSKVFSCSLPKYLKVVKIAMVQVLGSVEDEQCVSSLASCKSKLRN
jgi:hypothetical protein